jgi:hypothetical protein
VSGAYSGGCAGVAIRFESGHAVALRTADWLCLAAAPTFAIMALLTSIFGGGPPDMLCSAGHGVSAERNGPNVPADERVPFAALAETDL